MNHPMTQQEKPYLLNLNEPQRDAVLHTEGPSMIIAGAGSGKTKVITCRIAHLLDNGVPPWTILSLTFTNKAAAEMRKRIEAMVGPQARNLWMGTFHSVFAKILRFEGERLGYPSNFTIYDTEDIKSLLRAIIKEMGLDDKVYKVNSVYGRISAAKNRLVSDLEYNNNPIYMEDDINARRPMLGKIYTIYQQRLFKASAMDFDDLLFNTNVLFRDHLDILNKYQQKFSHIMVDEYQDTNTSQYVITKKLAAVHRNLCVVGDDAQSIYAFRGADISNILNFEHDYPERKVFRLEQNYRSSSVIVQAANSVIKNNQKQLKKNVWTANDEGYPIDVIKAHTDTEEGSMVATTIFEEKMREGWQNKDFAILYRTNAQSRSMEEALRRRNIKYRIVGGLSFYQRKEIKDVMAYMRLTLNPNDEEAFKRVINLPKRGIGDTTVNKLIVFAAEQGADLWDVVCNAGPVVGGRAMNPINDFVFLIKSFQQSALNKTAYDFASQVVKESGLMRELREDRTPEGISRIENIDELLGGIQEFTEDPEVEDKSIGSFMQNVALLTDADNDKDQSDDVVTMMTIHMAKGLEFKSVFIVGMEENLFPSQMMLQSQEDLEEERRLFYVAITRAEKRLRLAYALSRYRFGQIQPCEPSRFLMEIDPQFLNMAQPFFVEEGTKVGSVRMTDQFKRPAAAAKPAASANAPTHNPSSNFAPSPVHLLAAGQKVEHQKFGFGRVIQIEDATGDKRAKIQFDTVGEKVLILTFAKLMIVEG